VTHIVSTLDELVRNTEETTDGDDLALEAQKSLKDRMEAVRNSTTAL